MINSTVLHKQLKAAGITFDGCNSNGEVWTAEGLRIHEQSNVAAIIANHEANYTVYQQLELDAENRKNNAKGTAIVAPNLSTLSAADAELWVENNTGNVADMRVVVREMARLIVSLRDERWPTMPDE